MQPIYIGPYDLGAQRDLEPFYLPEKAFPTMTNAFNWRGRIRKKPGYVKLGRLQRCFEDINYFPTGASPWSFNLLTVSGYVQWADNANPGQITTPYAHGLTTGDTVILTGVTGATGYNNVTFTITVTSTTTFTIGANAAAFGAYTGGGYWISDRSIFATEANASLVPGSVEVTLAGPIVITDQADGTMTSATPGNSGTIDYVTGDITLTHTAGAAAAVTLSYCYYPALPVMGLPNYETDLSNFENLFAFDTKYSYYWDYVTSSFMELDPGRVWTGDDADLFWSTNYWQDASDNPLFWTTNNTVGLHGYAVTLFGGAAAGPPSTVNVTAAGNTFEVGDTVFFVNLAGAGAANNLTTGTVTVAGNPFTISNPDANVFANGAVTGLVLSPNRNVAGDGIRYYDGTDWLNFNPAINPTTALMGAKIILPYKDRLIVFDTYEGASLALTSTNYPQRARWCQNGSPIDFNNGWRDDIVGRGGFVDAPTNQRIISAGYVKDQLIVYFERSTWQLVYTGNEVLPFVWKQINSELGVESTFSRVTFDNGLIGMGQTGVHTTNGFAVERIDEKIPNTVWTINNFNDGPQRVYGIRDFYNELAYFTYPEQQDQTAGQTFPNKVLVYNYRNGTFSFFNESFTCYGYFQRDTNLVWGTLPYAAWYEWDSSWNSGVSQALFPDVVAGNQQGYVLQLVIGTNGNDLTRYISAVNTGTNTITSPDHNLFPGNFVYFSGALGITGLNGNIFEVLTTTNDTFTISATLAGTYIGAGEFISLSNINIWTRMFNFYWKEGKRVRCVQVDFLLDRTDEGEFSVDFFVDQANTFSLTDPSLSAVLGAANQKNHVLTRPEPDAFGALQNEAAQIWHRLFTYGQGQEFQLHFYLDDLQMQDLAIAQSSWRLHGMILWIEPDGSLL